MWKVDNYAIAYKRGNQPIATPWGDYTLSHSAANPNLVSIIYANLETRIYLPRAYL